MVQQKSSKISGFYKMSTQERRTHVSSFAMLNDEENAIFNEGLSLETADRMVENVVGVFELPMGVAMNFLIDGVEYMIPMVTEESSVIAAASNGAKIARLHGGFTTSSSDPLMIGQLQVLDVEDPVTAAEGILDRKDQFLAVANAQDAVLVKLGGGAKDIEVRLLDGPTEKMVVVHLIVDVRDAMGANAVNTMCEALAPVIEETTGGHVRLKILSNLCDKRLFKATAVFEKDRLGGESVVDAFLESYMLAVIDPYRAATHNKGIMNGIDAVVLATGNDTRAVEAGVHAYAARDGQYSSLTRYWKDEDGNLVGEIELPLALGTVGGAGNVLPKARLAKRILSLSSTDELSRVVAALGLAQNFAAVFALSTVGIQKGHMSLHAKNIAVMAGATGELIEKVAEQLVAESRVKLDRAEELVRELSKKG